MHSVPASAELLPKPLWSGAGMITLILKTMKAWHLCVYVARVDRIDGNTWARCIIQGSICRDQAVDPGQLERRHPRTTSVFLALAPHHRASSSFLQWKFACLASCKSNHCSHICDFIFASYLATEKLDFSVLSEALKLQNSKWNADYVLFKIKVFRLLGVGEELSGCCAFFFIVRYITVCH